MLPPVFQIICGLAVQDIKTQSVTNIDYTADSAVLHVSEE